MWPTGRFFCGWWPGPAAPATPSWEACAVSPPLGPLSFLTGLGRETVNLRCLGQAPVQGRTSLGPHQPGVGAATRRHLEGRPTNQSHLSPPDPLCTRRPGGCSRPGADLRSIMELALRRILEPGRGSTEGPGLKNGDPQGERSRPKGSPQEQDAELPRGHQGLVHARRLAACGMPNLLEGLASHSQHRRGAAKHVSVPALGNTLQRRARDAAPRRWPHHVAPGVQLQGPATVKTVLHPCLGICACHHP